MLVCHTSALKDAHDKLELRGVFDTKATDPNISDVQVKNPQASIFVLTGCESGFSSKEGKILQKQKKFFFRTNTLRAETAIIVSCIAMKTIIGEL